MIYLQIVNEALFGNETDLLLRGLLLEGYKVDQVLSAYGMSRVLDIGILSLLTEKAPSQPGKGNNTQSKSVQPPPEGISDNDYRNYLLLAEDFEIKADSLIEYALNNGSSFQEMELLCEQSSAYVNELRTLDPPLTTMSSGSEEESIPTQEYGAPYSYQSDQSEKANLNTGGLVYETVDYVLPGINGLDLIIGRRYDSDAANVHTPVKSYDIIPVYAWFLFYGSIAYTYNGSSYIRSPQYDIPGDFWGPLANKAEAEYYENYFDGLVEIIPNYKGTGTTVMFIYYAQAMFIICAYMDDYRSKTEANSYLNSLYGLGTGWSLMFSSIEDGKILHLADGRSFEISITSTPGDSNLKDYTLTDLRLEKENNLYSNGPVSSAYTLYYKDGTREYFSSNGKLIGIRDKYNNTIKFVNDTVNSQPRITITDTLSRVTTISSSPVSSGARTVTVALPDSVNLGYTVTNGASPVSHSSLTAYSDPMNIATNYSYTVSSGGFNTWAKNTSGATNYFLCLTTITHPTGATSEFTWGSTLKNLGSSGLQACFRLTSRKDKIGSVVYNEKTYSYSANNNSGYPANGNPSNLPTGFTYSTTVTTPASGVSDAYSFNNKHLATLVETKHGSKNVWISFLSIIPTNCRQSPPRSLTTTPTTAHSRKR